MKIRKTATFVALGVLAGFAASAVAQEAARAVQLGTFNVGRYLVEARCFDNGSEPPRCQFQYMKAPTSAPRAPDASSN